LAGAAALFKFKTGSFSLLADYQKGTRIATSQFRTQQKHPATPIAHHFTRTLSLLSPILVVDGTHFVLSLAYIG
jgi:hypothetical protein